MAARKGIFPEEILEVISITEEVMSVGITSFAISVNPIVIFKNLSIIKLSRTTRS